MSSEVARPVLNLAAKVLVDLKERNPKFQVPSSKEMESLAVASHPLQPSSKPQSGGLKDDRLRFGIWSFFGIWGLGFGISLQAGRMHRDDGDHAGEKSEKANAGGGEDRGANRIFLSSASRKWRCVGEINRSDA